MSNPDPAFVAMVFAAAIRGLGSHRRHQHRGLAMPWLQRVQYPQAKGQTEGQLMDDLSER